MPAQTVHDLAIGIDLGGTNAQIGLVDSCGQVVERLHMPTKAEDGSKHTITRLAEGIHAVCAAAAGTTPDAASAIGIGAAGSIDAATGTIVEAPNLRWTNVPLASMLHKELGDLPIVIDNDVNAAIAGEAAYGAARNERDVLGVWVGTGIGGGIILDGNLIRGPLGSAGEIGRTLLLSASPIGMQRLEDICSRASITRRLHELIQTNHPTSLRDALLASDNPRAFPAKLVAEAYAAGDELVRTVIDEAADLLGRGIASACTLLGTPLVVMGGGLTEALGQPYVDAIGASCNHHVLPRLQGHMRFCITALGPDAGIIGAATLSRKAHPATKSVR